MKPPSARRSVRATVRRPMNDRGTMTVEVSETDETRRVVEYESDRLRRTLSQLPSGTTVSLAMSRADVGENVWRVREAPGGRTAAHVDAERVRIVE